MQTLKLNSKGEEVKNLQKKLNLYPDGFYGKLTEEAVKHQQWLHGLTQDGVCGPKTWQAIISNHEAQSTECQQSLSFGNIKLKRTTRHINRIIVHCSATVEGKDYTIKDITQWHKQRGYTTIGYHYVIYRDGTIHEGRDINQIGAHTENYNTGSIGICYIGGLDKDGKTPKDTRTNEQKTSLRALLAQLRVMYHNPKIYGHNNFAKKACPSFDATKEYEKL